jgi:hypothetical protein
MKKILYFLSVFPILPTIAFAHTLSAQSLITKFLTFSNRVLIPFALALAFLFFLINVIRFFVINGAEEDGRKNAKNLALYSVLAFVVLIVFWGIINLLAGSTTLNGKTAPTPDYVQKNEGGSTPGGRSTTATPGATTPTTPTTPSGGGTTPTPPTGGSQPIDLLPPGFGGGPEVVPIDDCDNGRGLDPSGNPCGIY